MLIISLPHTLVVLLLDRLQSSLTVKKKIAGSVSGSQTLFQSLGSQWASHKESFGMHFTDSSSKCVRQTHLTFCLSMLACVPRGNVSMSYLPAWMMISKSQSSCCAKKTRRGAKWKGIRSSQRHVGTLKLLRLSPFGEGGQWKKNNNFKWIRCFCLSVIQLEKEYIWTWNYDWLTMSGWVFSAEELIQQPKT